MFSALKKLARGSEERAPGAAPARMPSSLQKKFSRGVHYNMKILIKGDRNVGKSCLLQRLQGGPFIEEYVPTDQIQAAAIHWTYKNTDHIVKVEVWEVVDKARSKKKPPLGLKLDNEAASEGGDAGDAPALDAAFLDVYKDASGVILMMDITKPWTFEYVMKELSGVPAELPLMLLGNHCDMQHHRQVHPHHVEQALHHARHTRTAPVRYAESSMRNGFGLRLLHKFLNVPFLRLQRATLLQQLQRNQRDAQDADLELNHFQNSEESNYVLFVERLASKRRAGAGEAPLAERSPSIVLGAGKPILPQHSNPLMTTSSAPTIRAAPPTPERPLQTQSQYVSAELLTPSSDRPVTSHTTPAPSKPPQNSRPDTLGVGAGAGGSGVLEEFYAGALDTSFLEDSSVATAQYTHPSYDTDSDNESTINPMVANAQDDLEDVEYRTSPFSTKPSRSERAGAAELRRRSLEVEELMSAVSVVGGRSDDAHDAGSQFELWAGSARRSPEGGEDPDNSAEPQSLKEQKKHKKSKKTKEKESERSERKEKKHKRKECKRQEQDSPAATCQPAGASHHHCDSV